MKEIASSPAAVNAAKVIRECQFRIANAFTMKGDGGALVAVACSSITIQAYIEAGTMMPDALVALCAISALHRVMPGYLYETACGFAGQGVATRRGTRVKFRFSAWFSLDLVSF